MNLRVLALALVLWPVVAGAQQARDTGAAAPPAARVAEGGRGQRFRADLRLGFDVTRQTLAAPAHWSRAEWVAVPATALALATLSEADRPVQGLFDRNRSSGGNRVLSAVEPLGAQGNLALVVATYGVGLALDVPALRWTGVEAAASSVVASGVVTPMLKLLVGRSRPRQEKGPFVFHALSGNASFPSGHTTQAFAVASVFASEARPLWAKALIYGLAGGVATARMYHDAHFLSDVTAGATIGTVVGRAVVARGHAELGKSGVAPYVGGDGVGLELRF